MPGDGIAGWFNRYLGAKRGKMGNYLHTQWREIPMSRIRNEPYRLKMCWHIFWKLHYSFSLDIGFYYQGWVFTRPFFIALNANG
jgi:hypothetical protein